MSRKRAYMRMWDDHDGVSPVIGTILMVAITVVLAAVVIAVIPQANPQGGEVMMGMACDLSGGNWVVKIINVQGGNVYVSDASVQIVNESTGAAVVRYPTRGTGIDDGDGANFDFYDNDANGRIDAGDAFNVHGNKNVTSGNVFKVFKGGSRVGESKLI